MGCIRLCLMMFHEPYVTVGYSVIYLIPNGHQSRR